MKKFAVGFISFFDNELNIEVVYADDWRDALSYHSHIDAEFWKFLCNDTNSLKDAKIKAFNCDCMIDIIEIK